MEQLITPSSSSGVSTAIVKALKIYSKSIPVDFLARLIGRSSTEVEKSLADLEKNGVVKRDGDTVSVDK